MDAAILQAGRRQAVAPAAARCGSQSQADVVGAGEIRLIADEKGRPGFRARDRWAGNRRQAPQSDEQLTSGRLEVAAQMEAAVGTALVVESAFALLPGITPG